MATTPPRRMRAFLIASLALNLFAVGVLASMWWFEGPPHFGPVVHDRPSITRMPPPRLIRATLGDEGQAALEAELDRHRPKVRPLFGELADARRAVADAVVAEPFDRARLDAAMANLRTREAVVAEGVQTMIGDLVERLGPAERDKLAGLLRPRPRPAKKDADRPSGSSR